MVCINQETGLKSEEPFSMLAQTRRFDGKVFFGQHACLVSASNRTSPDAQNPTIAVGDLVQPYLSDDAMSTTVVID
jgi:molybdenum cofactor sulfurtransferase